MEQEYFLSGYCRCMDASRMVEVITDGTVLVEADCSYESCPHTPNCTVAAGIRQLLEKA